VRPDPAAIMTGSAVISNGIVYAAATCGISYDILALDGGVV
jgi:hypothetical protein